MECLCQGWGLEYCRGARTQLLSCETSPDSWAKAGGTEEIELKGCPTGLEKRSVELHGVGRVACVVG